VTVGGTRAAAELLTAYQFGADVEAVLDAIDTREAASDLAGILAGLIEMSGLPPTAFLRAVKATVIAEHMRRAVLGAVT
jgi:hypothetical protein